MHVLARIWRLARLAASGPGSSIGLTLLVVVLALELASIWISLRLIAWNQDFFDALENFDTDRAIWQVGVFFMLTTASATRFLVADYLRKYVLIRWRSRLTDVTITKWLSNKSYWLLREGLSPQGLENPDQRIAEDCRLFVSGLLNESLDLFTRIVGIFSYVALLWSLSTFALSFAVFGFDISIPRYLVWASFIYVLISSILTHMLGWPLKNLFFEQERREADFRYSLVQLRDNAAEVAMSRGEAAERHRFDSRFSAIVGNWRRLIGREFIVGLFTRPYFQTVLRIPLFLSLPAYLAREVTLGGLMQLSSAFSNVTTTLSWFIFSYRDLADFVATSERLDGLLTRLDRLEHMPDAPREIDWSAGEGDTLEIRDLTLFTPQGRELRTIGELKVEAGKRLWIRGPSGIGKTTLLRALAGLWPYGTGAISLPETPLYFASQTPYLVGDGLRHALTYPEIAAGHSDAEIAEALSLTGLDHRIADLERDEKASLEGLSAGERQRVVFARILLAKPAWIVLDEPTSALDRETEDRMFALLRERLPDATVICVSHRVPEALSPYETLMLGDNGTDGESEGANAPE